MVITHNRGTIEAADALYGVTVGDDAVSRVISLRLAEATVLAGGGLTMSWCAARRADVVRAREVGGSVPAEARRRGRSRPSDRPRSAWRRWR